MQWLRRQVKEAKTSGIVMGLSGGIDSSVVAALSKEAVGKDKLLALIMPIHSQSQDLNDACLIARALGIKTKVIDLSGTFDSLIRLLPEANSMTQANLKPRLRMLVLYYFANKLNYLVCGTGNKSELMVGYFTKHGDGATDILPIGNLLKKQVRILARELKIPGQIIAKTPTAGLWPDQTDEGEMGISYSELDDILERLQNNKKQLAPKSSIDRVKAMIKKSGHKRQMPRVCNI